MNLLNSLLFLFKFCCIVSFVKRWSCVRWVCWCGTMLWTAVKNLPFRLAGDRDFYLYEILAGYELRLQRECR